MTRREDMTPEARLDALLERMGVPVGDGADDETISEASEVAPVPPAMAALFRRTDLVRFGEVEPFEIAAYIEVNEDRATYDEVASGIYVASDLADGWFFVDPDGFMGLGAGFVFWVERGRFAADDCVPAAESLIDLFEAAADGETPWKAPMLGERALDRLLRLLRTTSSASCRAPLDPDRLRAPGQFALPRRLSRILEEANGFRLHLSEREFFGLERIRPVEGTGEAFGLPGAVWIGEGPDGVRYAGTCGTGWLGLPADRMIEIRPGANPEDALLLGRTPDVWAAWIRQDEKEA